MNKMMGDYDNKIKQKKEGEDLVGEVGRNELFWEEKERGQRIIYFSICLQSCTDYSLTLV